MSEAILPIDSTTYAELVPDNNEQPLDTNAAVGSRAHQAERHADVLEYLDYLLTQLRPLETQFLLLISENDSGSEIHKARIAEQMIALNTELGTVLRQLSVEEVLEVPEIKARARVWYEIKKLVNMEQPYKGI